MNCLPVFTCVGCVTEFNLHDAGECLGITLSPGGSPVQLTMSIAILSLSLTCSFYRKGRIRAPFLPGGIVECAIAIASQVQCKKPQ
jgi:hypothetical protein